MSHAGNMLPFQGRGCRFFSEIDTTRTIESGVGQSYGEYVGYVWGSTNPLTSIKIGLGPCFPFFEL